MTGTETAEAGEVSLTAEIALRWGDGEYIFRLGGREIEQLQKLCNAGLGAIYQRVHLGVWFWGDLYHTVRLGLIGGGMDAVEAMNKVDFYMKPADRAASPLARGPSNPETVAKAVLDVVMQGVALAVREAEDLPLGEASARRTRADT